MEFKPGITKGISYDEYERIPALRSHVLNDMRRSPAHCRYNLDHPGPSKEAYVLGEAVHCAVLEPERFLKQYISRPVASPENEWAGKHKNSNDYKDGYALWSLDHGDKVILTPKEFRECCALRDAAYRHPVANTLLTGKGMNEVVICWIDPGTEIPCKARLDRMAFYGKHTIVLDVKTTRDASPWKFGYDAAKFGYNLQGAWYRRGLKVLDDRPRQIWMLALEKEPPYCAVIYKIDDEALNVAESTMQNLVFKYAECEKESNWPGYSNGIEKLQLPKFSYYEEGQED